MTNTALSLLWQQFTMLQVILNALELQYSLIEQSLILFINQDLVIGLT